MEPRIYRCEVCGEVAISLGNFGDRLSCCNQLMTEQNPNNIGEPEIHIPRYYVKGWKVMVNIGDIPHPMANDHYIEWILLRTNKRLEIRNLKPGDKPQLWFPICKGEVVLEVLAYCNIHSLWRQDVETKSCKCEKGK